MIGSPRGVFVRLNRALNSPLQTNLPVRLSLALIALLFTALSIVGITWGLPGRKIDKYLFGDGPVWSGEKIYRLAGGAEKFAGARGADVDVDPLKRGDDPVRLTATEEDVARIYLRYRLYTYQPDEMIAMMALARMKPRSFDFDPRLYQYGGLFLYPVGALIGLGGALGLIDVRSDVAFYLDHPDEFGKFYLVARGYAAAWGVVGAFVVFSIARRLGGNAAGLPAALLFTLMPVVICMAHEGKPHLPGAVLMLAAVYFAMRHMEVNRNAISQSSRNWWFMCICCGAALGMVLSSLPIFILIPLTALLSRIHQNREPAGAASLVVGSAIADQQSRKSNTLARLLTQTTVGVLVAAAVYLLTNPYIVINALTNRDILRSNFGNSLAMYEISRIGEGFTRVLELTAEGATWPVVIVGVIGLGLLIRRQPRRVAPLAVVALVFFLQFVLIGAGKPGEYGRFGIFTNTALAIAAAVLCSQESKRYRDIRRIVTLVLLISVAWSGSGYLQNFIADTGEENSRLRIAEVASRWTKELYARGERPAFAVSREPAPYCFPPIDFAKVDIALYRVPEGWRRLFEENRWVFLDPSDRPRGPYFGFNHPRHAGPVWMLRPPEHLDPEGISQRDSVWDDIGSRRITEISWANKPFSQNWWAAVRQSRMHSPAPSQQDTFSIP